MPNAITFSVVTSDNVSTRVYLTQDEATPTTIHGVFGSAGHDLTGCSASAEGTSVSGKTKVLGFFDDTVSINIAPSRVAVAVAAYGDIGGAISADDEASLTAFVLAAKLPLLAS